jgi:hypothetical protein
MILCIVTSLKPRVERKFQSRLRCWPVPLRLHVKLAVGRLTFRIPLFSPSYASSSSYCTSPATRRSRQPRSPFPPLPPLPPASSFRRDPSLGRRSPRLPDGHGSSLPCSECRRWYGLSILGERLCSIGFRFAFQAVLFAGGREGGRRDPVHRFLLPVHRTNAVRLICCCTGFARRRRRLCDSARARRVRVGAEMKGASSIPAVASIPSPLFLWRVKVRVSNYM